MNKSWCVIAVLLVFPLSLSVCAGEAGLKSEDIVAVCGDSITEQKQYSVLIEDYLLMCKPAPGIRAAQFGWGGETAGGFLMRMNNETLRWKPTVATTCYGMNDGGYSPMDPNKAKNYREKQTAIVETFKKGGVRLIIVGSPGCVDSYTFRRADPNKLSDAAVMYNKTLGAERDIAREVAEKEGVLFANVFDPMVDVMNKCKQKYGMQYALAGGDGVHPDTNGHLVMAYAFLKAMGCNGEIGTITADLGANSAEASDGHKVLSMKAGVIELESSRYPFCFFGDPKATNSTRGVIEFLPFNEELNRFKLVVKNPGAEKVKVTWGSAPPKEFSAADLAKGINLAAEFLDNPFAEPFRACDRAVRTQQEFETPLVKSLLHSMGDFRRMMPEESEAFERISAKAVEKDKALMDASSAAVVPVKHSIKLEPVK